MLTLWITVSSHLGQDLQHLIQSMHEQAGVRALMPRICNANLKGMAQDCTVRLAKFQSLFFLANAEKTGNFPKVRRLRRRLFPPLSCAGNRPNVGCGREPSLCISAGLGNSWLLPTNMKKKWIMSLNVINMNIWYIIWIYIYIYDIYFSELQISHVWCKQW